MEVLISIILEPLLYAYLNVFEQYIGEAKLKPWLKYFLIALCILVFLTAFFLMLIGVFWIMDEEPFYSYGKSMLIYGSITLLIHIILAVFFKGHNIERHIITKKENEALLEHRSLEPTEPIPITYYVDTDTSKKENHNI